MMDPQMMAQFSQMMSGQGGGPMTPDQKRAQIAAKLLQGQMGGKGGLMQGLAPFLPMMAQKINAPQDTTGVF